MQVKLSPAQVQDNSKVRMGALSPSFPAPRSEKPETTDQSKVRMGALSPAFPQTKTEKSATADSGKVRMGALGPSFPAVRSDTAEPADQSKVRMGALSPSFPAAKAEKTATADSRSCSKAFVSACSTVLMLMAPLASGDGVGVITPCSFTTATTSLRSTRSASTGIREASLSVTLITPG